MLYAIVACSTKLPLFHRELSSQPNRGLTLLTVLTSCIKEWRFLESRLLYVSAASTAEMNVMSANVSGVSCGLSISSPVSRWSALEVLFPAVSPPADCVFARSKHPEIKSILHDIEHKRFLDLGCCMGTDVRKCGSHTWAERRCAHR